MAKPSRVRRSPSISGSASPSRSVSSGSRSPPPRGKRRATRIQESLVLRVDSLNRNVNESHLKEIFHNFGEVVHVELAMDRAVNCPKRYAYVEFKTRTDAEKAQLAMDGGQIDGNFVKAKFTLRPRQKVPPPPNSVSSAPKREAPKSDNTSADVHKAGPQRPERKERSYLQFIKIETKKTPITTPCSSSLTRDFFDSPLDSKCFNVGALDELFVRVGTRNKLISNDNWSGDDTVCYFNFPADKKWLSRWSPRGSFFVTCYYDMVIIWGSRYHQEDHTRLMRFNHYQVEQFDLSPGEKYLVTYNRPKPSDSDGLWLKIFDVRTGRGIVGLNNAAVADSPQWPVIRWAGGEDDEYFATLNKNNKTASVYETKNLNLLGSPLLDLDDVIDISWSPTEPVLAILLKAGGKLKALLLRVPDKVKLAEKDLTGVVGDCKMHWQSNGEYLAVNTDGGFEFFRIKEEEGISADFLKVDKEMLAFAWEPRGDRFAVIYGGDEVSFYSMKKPGKVTELTTLSNKQADALFWSPNGSLIVLAGLKAGKLEFYNVDRLVGISPVETVNANKVVWNPSGRYIATASTIPEEDFNRDWEGKENGPLNIWSSDGKLLCKHQFDSPLLQLDWRPYGRTTDDDMQTTDDDMLKT